MKDELSELKKGATWQNVCDMLWHIGTVRYVTEAQLKKAFKKVTWCNKCVTPRKIAILSEKKYIALHENSAMSILAKGKEFLKTYSDFNTDLITIPKGTGGKDNLTNAEILLWIVQLPDFFALFYPDSDFYENPGDHQPFLIPDGALLFRRGDKAKLVFLEIENPKPNWLEHLESKKWKYSVIAKRKETWSVWWLKMCEKLQIRHCPMDEFGFGVWCIGDFKPDSEWPGWTFKKDVREFIY